MDVNPQNYGIQWLPTLTRLQELKLLCPQQSTSDVLMTKTNHQLVSKTLHLVVDEEHAAPPDQAQQPSVSDISHVFSGYAPLSVRLIQTMTQSRLYVPKPSSSPIRDASRPTFQLNKKYEDVMQVIPGGPSFASTSPFPLSGPMMQDKKKNVLVLFLGGITYAEIAAIRLLNEESKGNSFF